MEKQYSIRQATIEQVSAIAALLETAKREDLPLEERVTRGYVQGDMSEKAVRQRFKDGFGALIALDETKDEIVGVNFYSATPQDPSLHHPLAGVAQTIATLQVTGATDDAGASITADNSLMYGPIAVADHAAGRGLARKLIESLLPIAHNRAAVRIISFVDKANSASLAMHRALGMYVLSEYTFKQRPYLIFALNL